MNDVEFRLSVVKVNVLDVHSEKDDSYIINFWMLIMFGLQSTITASSCLRMTSN